MKILGENAKGFLIHCDCGTEFIDDGADDSANCPHCSDQENIDQLVQRWWAKAGWALPEPTVHPYLPGASHHPHLRLR